LEKAAGDRPTQASTAAEALVIRTEQRFGIRSRYLNTSWTPYASSTVTEIIIINKPAREFTHNRRKFADEVDTLPVTH